MVICTLQLLSPSCQSPKLMKHFQQLSSISLRPLTFAAAKEKACTDPCAQSVTGCTELGQKGTCNTTVRRVIRKRYVCEMQRGSTTAQSSTALDRCTQQGKHTALIARHIWAGGAAKPCVSLLRQSITRSKLTAQNRRQYLILTFPKQFLLAQVIHTQELSNSN